MATTDAQATTLEATTIDELGLGILYLGHFYLVVQVTDIFFSCELNN